MRRRRRLPSPPAEKKRGHSRIPSVVLSPTPTSPLEKLQDIQLVVADGFTLSVDMPAESATPQFTYRAARVSTGVLGEATCFP